MEGMTGYYNTFVVKIWSDEDAKTIRGYIQHVSTREHAYFLSLENMTEFIANHLSPPLSDSVRQGKAKGGLSVLFEGIGDVDG